MNKSEIKNLVDGLSNLLVTIGNLSLPLSTLPHITKVETKTSVNLLGKTEETEITYKQNIFLSWEYVTAKTNIPADVATNIINHYCQILNKYKEKK
ncbi:hypothetical protein [Streptococcus equi]|uniref:hypothetical protein n=1 Tax=Streptococcus equi TaxID=1336 RepID=UPI000659D96D|nr:hypothetical protein [Streptococcus equi]MBT1201714.1 hypothetical protein [Streptococcus equi subsp. equi]MBT1208685.1 hypothetical protein [Streptococcus equi subsp. equi]MBT1212122.1 hypothetical protein [Streptococcus equi subsp. equi]MBT1216904.1 hypothetical protein [Streptococcus equi subsp. equi]MCD3371747.1 hypothetical protein [Streptococcus equi subsp. zooepidemicus]